MGTFLNFKSPFITFSDEHGSLILSYMFNGHYDAVVDTPDMDNPEYTAWCERRGADDFASETLARKLQVTAIDWSITQRRQWISIPSGLFTRYNCDCYLFLTTNGLCEI